MSSQAGLPDASTSAQQIEMIEKIHAQWREALKTRLSEMELRKWCVEQSAHDMTAEAIFKFVTAPLASLLDTL